MKNTLVIGVDIGGTRTKCGLVDIVSGQVLHQIVKPTEKRSADKFMQQMTEIIHESIAFAIAIETTVTGIGFGIPGFTLDNGTVVTTYGFLDFMENYSIKNIIEEKFSLPCFVDNDARIVCLGEALYGKGIGYERVLTLTLGTGVGFGFVVNGKFTDSSPLTHMGGHMKITDDGETCYCGKRGCLESLVSSTGILHIARQHNWSGALAAEAIFDSALRRDATAEIVVEKLTSYLHIALHNYVNLFAPDVIVLGGGMAKGLGPYLAKIKGANYLSPYPAYSFQLYVSELEELAGVLGSAALFQLNTLQSVNS